MAKQRDYDSTVARIAGNLLSGMRLVGIPADVAEERARDAVIVARAIIAEVKRTEPAPSQGGDPR